MGKKITLDFAKKLCPDFELVNRKDLGKKACMHLMKDGEMCRRGDHFLCELVLFKHRSLAKEQRDAQEAISASRINLIDTCARKYRILRELYIKPPGGTPVFLLAGRAFSTARARMDQELPVDINETGFDLPPVDRAKLRAALRFYRDHAPYPPGSVTCEDHCQFEFEGAWFSGYSDAMSLDGGTIVEWKYAQKKYQPIDVARAAAIYLKGNQGAERFVLYRMRKPAHRPKKRGETMAEYEERMFEAMCEDGPKKIIHTLTITREDLDVDGILREMISTFENVLPALHKAGMPPNYSSCDLCDFAEICQDNLGASTEEIVRRLRAMEARS